MSATPLPVSIALAGHTKDRLLRNVSATSMIAQVRIDARICGTLTWKRSPTCPRTWIVMMTAATFSRGSRMFGRITGYVLPPSVSVRLVTSSPATASFVGRTLRPVRRQWSDRVVQSVRVRRAGPHGARRAAPDPAAGDPVGRSSRRLAGGRASSWWSRSCCRPGAPVDRLRTPARRRGSSTRRPRRASTTPTTASSSSSSAGEWRRSTATTTVAPSCSSPAAASRPRCTATRARWAVRSASHDRRRRSPT